LEPFASFTQGKTTLNNSETTADVWRTKHFTTPPKMKKQKTILFIGLIGLSIHLVLNLLGIFVFKKPAAVFFTEPWWSSWFPMWLAWGLLTISGLGIRFRLQPVI
jgi:hypothetical protein